ncbi:unnamed protein product [[Candida] boidinii]|uniref:Unnamed protein product n=1 Tax=Candida boidinii TaxID=5477 RepID=A0A9W6T1W9_CANBO|nr:unnamed protein product [[Candida] boidinii]GMG07296.1 unnamed protein product [[Candida] boidinii]
MNSIDEHKSDVRSEAWAELRKVAKPDSKFHYNFAEFIADYEGSDKATKLFKEYKWYKDSEVLFITPDNCVEELRYETLKDGKKILMTTYGIYRGFWLLDPNEIPESRYEYASTLEGMEKVAKHVTLQDMIDMKLKVDVLVTGTGAINMKGIRFGKGHGFFDCEWGMLYSIGAVKQDTPTVAFVHDCQLLDQELTPDIFDTICELIVTPTKIIEVYKLYNDTIKIKPTVGILWDRLDPKMLETIPPLQELKKIQNVK